MVMVGLNSTGATAQARPVLHVECCTKVTETLPETVRALTSIIVKKL